MIETASLMDCTADEITSTGLQQEIAREGIEAFETYRLVSPDVAERGNLIFHAENQRGAVAWGADADWTDASSAEEVLHRWLTDTMIN